VFVSLLEPAMLILMGGVVGFIVIAMLLPIFTMNSVMN
jgi:type II secretory pathway component PulF